MGARPRTQALALAIVAIVGGMLMLGSLLDAVSNALALITIPIAVLGTAVIAVGAISIEFVCRKRGISWRSGGSTLTIRRLGSKWWLSVGGAIVLLWLPTLVSIVRPPRSEEADRADVSSTSGSSNEFALLQEVLPLVDNKSNRFSVRSMALSQCIDGGVLRGAPAFEKASELMQDAPADPDERRLAFPQLVDVLAADAPDHLHFIATRFSWATDFGPNDQSEEAYSNQAAAEFWWMVFQRSLSEVPERMLGAIANLTVSEQHFRATLGLCANLPETARVQMRSHSSPVVRGLVAVRDASTGKDNTNAIQVIRDLVQVESDRDLAFAAQLLRAANREAIVDAELARICLAVVDRDRLAVPHHSTLDLDKPRGREDRLHAASDYVQWAVTFRSVADPLEPELVAEANRYADVLRELNQRPPEYGNGDQYARTCIKAMLQMNQAMHGTNAALAERVSPEVFAAIEELRSFPPELLDRLNLGFLVE